MLRGGVYLCLCQPVRVPGTPPPRPHPGAITHPDGLRTAPECLSLAKAPFYGAQLRLPVRTGQEELGGLVLTGLINMGPAWPGNLAGQRGGWRFMALRIFKCGGGPASVCPGWGAGFSPAGGGGGSRRHLGSPPLWGGSGGRGLGAQTPGSSPGLGGPWHPLQAPFPTPGTARPCPIAPPSCQMPPGKHHWVYGVIYGPLGRQLRGEGSGHLPGPRAWQGGAAAWALSGRGVWGPGRQVFPLHFLLSPASSLAPAPCHPSLIDRSLISAQSPPSLLPTPPPKVGLIPLGLMTPGSSLALPISGTQPAAGSTALPPTLLQRP